MPLLTVRQIAEQALRKVGAFAINDVNADPRHVAQAITDMNLCVDHLSATHTCLWLVPSTASIGLSAGVARYDLATGVVGTVLERLQWALGATVRLSADGTESAVDLIQRPDYDGIGNKMTGGRPDQVFIDRDGTPTLYVYPVPGSDDYTLNLRGQTLNPDIDPEQPNAAHGLRQTWQKWLVYATACELAQGTFPMQLGELGRLERERDIALGQLLGFENRSHMQPRLVRPARHG